MYKKLIGLMVLCLLLAACGTAAEPSASELPEQNPTGSVSDTEEADEPDVRMPAAIVKEQSGVCISVEPAIELLAVVQHLSEYTQWGLITNFDLAYKQDIDEFFGEITEHEAILFTNRHMNSGLSFDLPPTAMLMLDAGFALDEHAFATSTFQDRTDADIDELIDVMRSFYKDSNFATFYLEHEEYYNTILERTAESFPDWDMIAAMEAFYGKEMESYHLVLSSMFHPGGYGPGIEREGGVAVYSVQGPLDEEDGLPVFGTTEMFSELVLHEFGHSFVPIGEAEEGSDIWAALEKSAYLMEPIQEQMQASAYPQWQTACEELVLRAAVIRMLEEYQGVDPAGLMQYEYEKGFIYIEAAYNALQGYIDDRAAYPVFDEFVPALLEEIMQVHPKG